MREDNPRRGDAETRRRGEKEANSGPVARITASPRLPLTASPFRVFYAIESPSATRESLAAHIERVRDEAPEVRTSWERKEKLHITLKFLGEVSVDKIAVVSEAASRAIIGTRPFPLSIERTGSFPLRGMPKILWLGIDDSSGGLAELHNKLEDACESVGFRREERPFHPHITIARIRSPRGARELAQIHEALRFEALEFYASELLVMRSELASGGSRYSEISRHKFIDEVEVR